MNHGIKILAIARPGEPRIYCRKNSIRGSCGFSILENGQQGFRLAEDLDLGQGDDQAVHHQGRHHASQGVVVGAGLEHLEGLQDAILHFHIAQGQKVRKQKDAPKVRKIFPSLTNSTPWHFFQAVSQYDSLLTDIFTGFGWLVHQSVTYKISRKLPRVFSEDVM
jgi:hypothetical protein